MVLEKVALVLGVVMWDHEQVPWLLWLCNVDPMVPERVLVIFEKIPVIAEELQWSLRWF